jgi:hypothetical protein
LIEHNPAQHCEVVFSDNHSAISPDLKKKFYGYDGRSSITRLLIKNFYHDIVNIAPQHANAATQNPYISFLLARQILMA